MDMDPKEIRNVMGHFATGVTIITTKEKNGEPSGLTANAFTSLSLNPPLVLVCIDKNSQSYSCFQEFGAFAVNVLTEEQEELSGRFATKGANKFEGTKWHTGDNGIPLIDGALGYIECTVVNGYEGGDHTIYVGEILSATGGEGRPLLFFKGKYQHLPPN
jgi:3-hydroxy-9,10-secoandrosta-1,3,5(10)-triene-9,17-dione monooxygenase reductase component